MGNGSAIYVPKRDDDNHWYIAEYTVTHGNSVRYVSKNWVQCMEFIVEIFKHNNQLDESVKDDIIKYGWVERFVDNNFMKGTVRIADTFRYEVIYDDMKGVKKIISKDISFHQLNYVDDLVQAMKLLKIDDIVIDNIRKEHENKPGNDISRIYNDPNMYINISFRFH